VRRRLQTGGALAHPSPKPQFSYARAHEKPRILRSKETGQRGQHECIQPLRETYQLHNFKTFLFALYTKHHEASFSRNSSDDTENTRQAAVWRQDVDKVQSQRVCGS